MEGRITRDTAQQNAKTIEYLPFIRWVEETVASIIEAQGLAKDCPKPVHVSGN
jgi:hypothetical protein